MLERKVRVTGRLGLHARAAANLVRVASQFETDLTLKRIDSGAEADAKSILSILMLAAARGTDLSIVANGKDASAALDAVVGLFQRDFDEDTRSEYLGGIPRTSRRPAHHHVAPWRRAGLRGPRDGFQRRTEFEPRVARAA